MVKRIIRKYLGFLGPLKRFFVAFIHVTVYSRETYSQYGEDVFIDKFLKKNGIAEGSYIDIGANHPTDISNTYLLYKNGFEGIVIDPNNELISLHKFFRKRDIHLSIGCGAKSGILEFKKMDIPVLSTFKELSAEFQKYKPKIIKKEYLPILRLDDISSILTSKMIILLSIDTEGMDLEILKSGNITLKNTLLVLIESNENNELILIEEYLNKINFEYLEKFGCNYLFINKILIEKCT